VLRAFPLPYSVFLQAALVALPEQYFFRGSNYGFFRKGPAKGTQKKLAKTKPPFQASLKPKSPQNYKKLSGKNES
jgi:hypothetical protein